MKNNILSLYGSHDASVTFVDDILSSVNFVKQCDFVFARNIYPNVPGKGEIIQVVEKDFSLNDGDIIFSKYEFLPQLFDILNNKNFAKNLKLISHESDNGIVESLFHTKPECILKWYAQNVEYDHKDLIPVPIGVACDYYQSLNLTVSQFVENKKTNFEKLLYINYRINTHPASRQWIYEYFKTNDWCTVDQPNLTLDQYREKITSHHFILCPRGNGIDTHRLWESLYHGIIPIVESHVHYNKCLTDLPVVIVDSFKEVTRDFLQSKILEMEKKTFNVDKLKVSWWIKSIREDLL